MSLYKSSAQVNSCVYEGIIYNTVIKVLLDKTFESEVLSIFAEDPPLSSMRLRWKGPRFYISYP